MSDKDYFVHESSYVDDNVQIGKGTKIWHFSHVQSGTRIGKNCTIGQNVNIGHNVIIGNSVKIQNNVSVYEGVELEDYVFCGPSMVFTNIKNPRSAIVRKDEFQETILRKGVTIGANATIVCGTSIGKFAFVAAGAVITKNVIDYALMKGVPAKQDGWISEFGEKLEFENNIATCKTTKQQYKLENGNCQKI